MMEKLDIAPVGSRAYKTVKRHTIRLSHLCHLYVDGSAFYFLSYFRKFVCTCVLGRNEEGIMNLDYEFGGNYMVKQKARCLLACLNLNFC